MWEDFWEAVKWICILVLIVFAWPIVLMCIFVWCLFKLIESF